MASRLSPEQIAQRVAWREAGLCPRCGKSPESGRVWCRGHMNGTYRRKIEQGKCPKCRDGEEEPLVPGFRRCRKHATENMLRQRDHRNQTDSAYQKEYARGKGRFKIAVRVAQMRGLSWKITEDDYWEMLSEPCFYCNELLDPTGTGLDRKDSKGIYEKENVVPCCGECNRIKGADYTFEEMLKLGETRKEILAMRKIMKEIEKPVDPIFAEESFRSNRALFARQENWVL